MVRDREVSYYYCYILLYCYKLLFGLLRLDTDKFFDFSPVSTTGGHAYKLYKPRCTNAVRKNFFTERVVNVWNSLPHNVDFFITKIQKFHYTS